MKIEKLLFVTKFEELWFDALQSLLDLRGAHLNHVIFLNVIDREQVAMRRGAGFLKQALVKLREKANIRFIDWAEHLFLQGMECGVYIVVGGLVQQALDAARKEEADLIVIGRHKKGKFGRLYSSSDITELIRRAPIPVLVYKYMNPEATAPETPFKRLLLALDWSPASQRAVSYLKELKGVVEEIHVVHVASEKSLEGDSAMTVQKTRKDCRQRLEETCDEFEAAGIPAVPHVYIGSPVVEIEKAARDCQATMMVLGTSGRGEWTERWIVSTPKTLAEKSIFPTLLVPPRKE